MSGGEDKPRSDIKQRTVVTSLLGRKILDIEMQQRKKMLKWSDLIVIQDCVFESVSTR